MARFHINPKTGEPGKCSASKVNCPFGNEKNHYPSREAARKAFEDIQKDSDNALFNWTQNIKVLRPSAQSSRAGDTIRWAADRHWQSQQEHRRHLFKFAGKLQTGCMYCGRKDGEVVDGEKKKIFLNEHLIPATKGGITVVGNLGPSCVECNGSKRDSTAEEYFSRKLEDPSFSHPVFGRSLSRFKDFLVSYQRPFMNGFPDEWELAQRVIAGEESAKDELVRSATRTYNSWRKGVFPPANGVWYTEEEDEEFAVRHFRGEFTSAKPSTETVYKDHESPFWKILKERSEGVSERTRQEYYSSAKMVYNSALELGIEDALKYWEKETVDQTTGRVKNSGQTHAIRKAMKILKQVGL